MGQIATKLEAPKFGSQKEIETFWVRGYIFREFTILNLVLGDPGSIPGRCKL